MASHTAQRCSEPHLHVSFCNSPPTLSNRRRSPRTTHLIKCQRPPQPFLPSFSGRAPGLAPVLDSCGVAGGHPPPQGSYGGTYVSTPHARLGDHGSKLPPRVEGGVVWRAGGAYEVSWTIAAKCAPPLLPGPREVAGGMRWTSRLHSVVCCYVASRASACSVLASFAWLHAISCACMCFSFRRASRFHAGCSIALPLDSESG